MPSRSFTCVLGHRALRAATLLLLSGPLSAVSAQWLQWGGPQRDFTSESKGLLEKWPADGPPKIWSREIGPGHSAIVTDGDTLYTMCRRGDKDAVLAVNAVTGVTVWETQYDAPTKEGMLLEFGPGPHSTPLIVGDRVFTVGGMVQFYCLDRKTGKVLWSHDLMTELSASHCGRGYGASPIAYKDTVIINAGGKETGVAAFKQDTGELVWKTERLSGGYASPILVRFNDEDHLIVALGPTRAGLDPATGKIRWRTTVDSQEVGIMSTPVWIGPDKFFCSAAYGGGTALFKLSFKDGEYAVEKVWHTQKMKVMHGNTVHIGDYVYGSSGDFGPAFMMAINLASGDIAWRQRGFAKATLLHADGKLIILDEEGNLALATATPEALKVFCQAKVLEDKSWTVPTLVGTRLYLRDEHNIMALELGSAAGKEVRS